MSSTRCPQLAGGCPLATWQFRQSWAPGHLGWQERVGGHSHGYRQTCCTGDHPCLCWDPLCSRELSHRRWIRATSAWPPGNQWGCATLAMSSLSKTSSRWVALDTGDTRLDRGMAGHGSVPLGKGCDGHLGPGTVGTGCLCSSSLPALCLPWWGAGLPGAGGLVVWPQGCPVGWGCCLTAA